MNKVLLVLGIILTVVGVIMFVVDFLPVDIFENPTEDTYLKSVSSKTISWLEYRLQVLISGLILIITWKLELF